MKIGELAAQSNLSRDTLRYYEDVGLIQSERLGNNYRDYLPETLEILQLIKVGKSLGFTLAQIGELVTPIFYGGLTFGESATLIEAHIEMIDRKIEDLLSIRDRLEHVLDHCPNHGRIRRHLSDGCDGADA